MKNILILLSAFWVIDGYALSVNSRISILTCGSGKDLYSSFGHTALRVVDNLDSLDIVFNYGTFDPSQDHFYQKFINGTLMYFLSVSDFDRFCEDYAEEGRDVIEQVLDLSIQEKKIIWNKLCYDYSEGNRYYKYDFVSNNCTTKVSDIVNLINPKYRHYPPESFRSHINKVIVGDISFFLNLLMGKRADDLLESHKRNCLPDIFMNSLDEAQIISLEKMKPLIVEKRVITSNITRISPYNYNIIYLSIVGVILCIDVFLLFSNYIFWIKYTRWIISPILLVTGLLGIIILFLGLVKFQLVYPNINIFLYSPLNLFLIPPLFMRMAKLKKYLILAVLISNLVYIALVFICLQEIQLQDVIYLVLLIMIYCILLYGNSKKFSAKNRVYCA